MRAPIPYSEQSYSLSNVLNGLYHISSCINYINNGGRMDQKVFYGQCTPSTVLVSYDVPCKDVRDSYLY